jgi:hypothetical protein
MNTQGDHRSGCSQPSTIGKGLSNSIPVIRSWPTSSAPFACFDGSCKPPELCSHCYLQYSAVSSAQNNEHNSFNASPQQALSTAFDFSSTATPYDLQFNAEFALIQHQHPKESRKYTQKSTKIDCGLSPMEQFLSEPMTSQPYHTAFSFLALPTASQPHTPKFSVEYKQENPSSVHGISGSAGPY